MRGGYGGMLMIGMATTLAGLALLNPISIGAGLLFGTKTVRDERKRMLQRRQAEAKQAVRRHIDEVTFQVGKDSRDMLRHTQRQLRDHYSALAEEVSTSIASSVLAAQNAVSTTTSERQSRDPRPQGRAGPHRRARRPGAARGLPLEDRRRRAALGELAVRSALGPSRVLVRRTIDTYRDSPQAVGWLQHNLARFDEPLRVAIAGKVKAGKSTLLNALVGEEIAPTDAGECTRVVTWYLDAPRRRRSRCSRARRPPRRSDDPPRPRRAAFDLPARPSRRSTSWRCSGRRRACAPRP